MDTNGAGDMFAGGFIGALILGKTLDEAIHVGHALGAMCVGHVSHSAYLSTVFRLMYAAGWASTPVAQGQGCFVDTVAFS